MLFVPHTLILTIICSPACLGWQPAKNWNLWHREHDSWATLTLLSRCVLVQSVAERSMFHVQTLFGWQPQLRSPKFPLIVCSFFKTLPTKLMPERTVRLPYYFAYWNFPPQSVNRILLRRSAPYNDKSSLNLKAPSPTSCFMIRLMVLGAMSISREMIFYLRTPGIRAIRDLTVLKACRVREVRGPPHLFRSPVFANNLTVRYTKTSVIFNYFSKSKT